MFQDRTLKCSECGSDFPFPATEQQYYDERGFRFPPRRCRECRKSRRDVPPPPEGRAPRGASERLRRDERPTHAATCSACGAATTVPFKPDPSRATFCRACYAARRPG
jgi:CxxC-x17-CxxC domain-containing protein